MSDEYYFEDLLRDGITALKGGDRNLASRLLYSATLINSNDARPWLWLSGTTDDQEEQLQLLEKAVTTDPSNATAARGLAMLKAQMGKGSAFTSAAEPPVAMESRPPALDQPPVTLEAQAKTFLCPKCGGNMSFKVQQNDLTCEFCGYVHVTDKVLSADASEAVIGLVLPTRRAHTWAEAQHRVSCEQCGAVTLLPPTLKTDHCPYCGSNRLIESTETHELLDPQVIALMKIDENGAYRRVRKWLKEGFFAPSYLALKAGGLRLRPAYYPAWTFDGTLAVSWACEVNIASGKNPRWVSRNGVETHLFDDILVPGLKALKSSELVSVEPFNLKDVVEFQPEYAVGWPTLSYDLSLAEASLQARERVLKGFQRTLMGIIEPGEQKRNIRTGFGEWSDFTYKHTLLPLWTGTYHYQGKTYRVLVNGQIGKVAGTKPRDNLKLGLVIAGGLLFALVLFAFAGVALSKVMGG